MGSRLKKRLLLALLPIKLYIEMVNQKSMNISQIITIAPDIQSGEPVFTHTRVPVKNLFDYLKAGDTLEEFLHDSPSVKKEQVVELLAFL